MKDNHTDMISNTGRWIVELMELKQDENSTQTLYKFSYISSAPYLVTKPSISCQTKPNWAKSLHHPLPPTRTCYIDVVPYDVDSMDNLSDVLRTLVYLCF